VILLVLSILGAVSGAIAFVYVFTRGRAADRAALAAYRTRSTAPKEGDQ
jgi:type II secretory pathway pseudopilin PulG